MLGIIQGLTLLEYSVLSELLKEVENKLHRGWLRRVIESAQDREELASISGRIADAMQELQVGIRHMSISRRLTRIRVEDRSINGESDRTDTRGSSSSQADSLPVMILVLQGNCLSEPKPS